MDQPPIVEPARRADPVTVLRIVSDILASRAWQWVTGLCSFALFGWACYEPHWIRLTAAAGFTIACHIPTWRKR